MTPQPIRIPPLGESVSEATIGTLLKASGTLVRVDEELLELETEKVNQPLYAPVSGLLTLTVKTGDTVKVGQEIGSILPQEVAAEKPAQKPVAPQPTPPQPTPSHPVRKKVDAALQEERSAPSPAPQASPPVSEGRASDGRTRRERMSKLRQVIGARLVQVKNETAMLTTFNEVDLSAVIAVREKEQENFTKRHGVKLGFMSFFVKAALNALKRFPAINARIEGDEIVYHNFFDIGIAVGTDKGLVVPVLRDADQMSYADIEKSLKNFADKARSGTLTLDEMRGGTFTITNGGVYGSLFSTPILNPPQSGILGMHAIQKRPMVVGDKIEIRPMMYLALSYDHRMVDGKESVSFLVQLKKDLEEPTRLLLDL